MKPKLFESVMQKQTEQKQIYEQLKQKTEHPFLKRYAATGITEGLFSDMVGALGSMHDTIVEAAYPELIGRNIIKVKPTNQPLERFPLNAKAVGYVYSENATSRLSGAKTSTVDITCNVLADSSEEWSRSFVEDASWNVLENMVENVGRAVGEIETQRVLALYGAISAGDLASGAALAGGGTALNWQGLLRLRSAVRGENFRPNVLAINEMQLHQLLNDDKFVHSQYLPSGETDLAQGTVTNILGMNVQASTLVPNGTAYAIDTRVAAVMLLRRDIAVEDWENPQTTKYGVRATTRFGLGVLRSKAVAKMTNIATTL